MFKIFDKINAGGVYVIAEMSANHGGSLENALEVVRRAAEVGADCVKVQTYTADTITIDCEGEPFQIHGGLWDGYNLYRLYQEAYTPWDWQPRIKEECERCGVDFLSTPFDNTAVDFLEEMGVGAYKIASFELVDIPLIEYAASKGKPMIISCGMGSVQEIQEAVDACRGVGNDQIVLLKCCSEYPANWADMHLANIPDMARRFGVPVGLSDHSFGSLGAVVGVALGACVIEKHVKLPGVESPDSGFSMDIKDFARMVEDVRNTGTLKGEVFYGPTPSERDGATRRRSLFAVRDIAEGEAFTPENVRSIRPGGGIAPKHLKALLGRRSRRWIPKGEPITEEIFSESR